MEDEYKDMFENDYISIAKLAVQLQLPRKYVDELITQGVIPTISVNGRKRATEYATRKALDNLANPENSLCPKCGSKMSLWCEKDVKERMDIKNKELQEEVKRLQKEIESYKFQIGEYQKLKD